MPMTYFFCPLCGCGMKTRGTGPINCTGTYDRKHNRSMMDVVGEGDEAKAAQQQLIENFKGAIRCPHTASA